MKMMINEANRSVVKIGLEGRVLRQQLFWPRNEHLLCETAMGIHFRMMTSLGAYWFVGVVKVLAWETPRF
jgi:hypothetical protein